MALPNLDEIELQYLDQWFSNLVDTVNFDLSQIEAQVVALNKMLTNIDAAPIKYLKDSLDSLVKNLNKGFKQIDDKFSAIDAKMNAMEAKYGVGTR